MAAPYSSPWHYLPMMPRAYWLPFGGIGNGLDAQTWATLIDTNASELILLLDTLSEAGIPAYAARRDRVGRRISSSVFRIWVGTWAHARAEDVIREALLRHRPPDGP